MQEKTAKERWNSLDGERQIFLDKCEQLSYYTLPYVCPPKEYNDKQDILQNDYQASGATNCTYLTNKLNLTMFAPSRKFYRIQLDDELIKQMQFMSKVKKEDIEEALSLLEGKSIKVLEKLKLRPKIIEVLTHLQILGNILVELRGDKMRNYSIRKWVVKRDIYSDVRELIIKECFTFSMLEKEIRELPAFSTKKPDDKVELYRWVQRNPDGSYSETQWVDDKRLPKKFDGKYTKEKLPYHALTWTLPEGSDYGIGHVEKVIGQLKQLSVLEKSRTEGAIMASEFRWLINPTGVTNVEDFEESENGQALSGNEQDVRIVSMGTASALPHIDTQIQSIKQELARFFLVGSAQTRNAERVTAEEIRMQAQELEVALGGAYTTIANEFQTPLAKFLLENVDDDNIIAKKGMNIVIVTGLDALSRNGDIDNMNVLLSNLAQVNSLPPPLLQQLSMSYLIKYYCGNLGIDSRELILSPEQVSANMMMQQQAQMMGAEGPAPGSTPTPAP